MPTHWSMLSFHYCYYYYFRLLYDTCIDDFDKDQIFYFGWYASCVDCQRPYWLPLTISISRFTLQIRTQMRKKYIWNNKSKSQSNDFIYFICLTFWVENLPSHMSFSSLSSFIASMLSCHFHSFDREKFIVNGTSKSCTHRVPSHVECFHACFCYIRIPAQSFSQPSVWVQAPRTKSLSLAHTLPYAHGKEMESALVIPNRNQLYVKWFFLVSSTVQVKRLNAIPLRS